LKKEKKKDKDEGERKHVGFSEPKKKDAEDEVQHQAAPAAPAAPAMVTCFDFCIDSGPKQRLNAISSELAGFAAVRNVPTGGSSVRHLYTYGLA